MSSEFGTSAQLTCIAKQICSAFPKGFANFAEDLTPESVGQSRGTIEWRPANLQRGYHLEWETFDQLMRKEG
jgi:hypothetical protein